MRTHQALATLLLVQCSIVVTACVAQEQPTEALVADVAPDDGLGADETMDVEFDGQATTEAEVPSESNAIDERGTFELTLCVNLSTDKTSVREAFCRSLPDKQHRGACWRHRYDNAVAWINWCVYQF